MNVNTQKTFIEFDLTAKEIEKKVGSLELADKIAGLDLLTQMFGKCSYSE